ncbi:hypothetical protein [Hymenobacter cellulosivorans]|uniref:Uncharacterized protein n=1 Tax=Hymenobacter cellulosivorans TaxID=2932249 RepID=A0ABY4F2W5_9BACT|nr:hypothetical protein [Hymenobacter cellulosivorans]UOQ51010.1 hypothetical protein MUN80_14715 [Hymenobacter cellulosivorans]
MTQRSTLAPALLSGLLLLGISSAARAQAPKSVSQEAVQEVAPSVSEAPAAPVQRRTDAHTINITMDSGPATAPAVGIPKAGSPEAQAQKALNGLPPAVDAGTFQALPAEGAALDPLSRRARLQNKPR